MSYLMNNQQKMNEIIFTDRNKSYGAYVIRSGYGNTIFKALSFMVLGFGSIIVTAFYMSNHNSNEPKIEQGQVPITDTVTFNMMEAKEEVKQEQKQESQKNESSGEKSNAQSNVIKDSAVVNTNTVLNTNTTVSTGSATGTDSNVTTGSGGGGTVTSNGNGTLTTEEPVHIPDSQPEFEDGLSGLYRFLGSKLVYPEVAKEIGKEGTVFVKFVVDQTGKVGHLTLLNSQGYGLDEEALRVVALIPKFKKPGYYNNRPVSVYYNLPIKFKLK